MFPHDERLRGAQLTFARRVAREARNTGKVAWAKTELPGCPGWPCERATCGNSTAYVWQTSQVTSHGEWCWRIDDGPPHAVKGNRGTAKTIAAQALRARRAKLFPQPYRERDGRQAKWWAVEMRFARPLTEREVIQLRAMVCNGYQGEERKVGPDGVLFEKWWNSFPGDDDEALLRRALDVLGIEARLRAAPFGRDCPGASCSHAEYHHLFGANYCRSGDIEAPDPIFTEADWITVVPREPGATSSPRGPARTTRA